MISKGLFVVWVAPWDSIAVLMAPDFAPRPIWRAFIPPVVSVALDARCVVWYIKSLKVIDCDLKDVVLTFAMLLPITSILTWWVLSPATPEKSDLIIRHVLLMYWGTAHIFYFPIGNEKKGNVNLNSFWHSGIRDLLRPLPLTAGLWAACAPPSVRSILLFILLVI